MTKGTLTITTGISESEQLSNHQNATLHSVTDAIAASIEIHPVYPAQISSEADAKAYLEDTFGALVAQGWSVNVSMGKADG